MAFRVKPSGTNQTDAGAIFTYSGTDVKSIAEDFGAFMVSEGYRLEKGTAEKGIYGIGNNTMRILFGAMVKRYFFDFEIKQEGETVSLNFIKNSWSGISGGIIGVQKLKKEMARLIEKIKTQ